MNLTLLQQTSNFSEPEADGLVKEALSHERDNGIAPVFAEGVPSLTEYRKQNLPLLRELTEQFGNSRG